MSEEIDSRENKAVHGTGRSGTQRYRPADADLPCRASRSVKQAARSGVKLNMDRDSPGPAGKGNGDGRDEEFERF